MTVGTTIRRSQRGRWPAVAGFLLAVLVPTALVSALAAGAQGITHEMRSRGLALPENDLPEGFVGLPFHTSVTVVGGSGVYSILAGGDLPRGVVLVRGGGVLALSGVPEVPGDFQLRVGVTDAQTGSSVSRTYNFHIGGQLAQPNVVTVPVSDAEVFHVSDADKVFFPAKIVDSEVLKFTDVDSVFKPAMVTALEAFKVKDAASIFGPDKPMDADVIHFGDVATVLLSAMTVHAEAFKFTDASTVSTRLGISPSTVPAGSYNSAYSQSFTAAGNTGTATLTPAGTLPTGLSFTPSGATITLHGTPTQVGSFTFSITAKDTSNTSVVSYGLVINKAVQTINFPSPPSPVVYSSGRSVVLAATSSAGAGYPVSYAVSGPATLSGSTLTYTGVGLVMVTATQAGDANYAVATPVTVVIQVTLPLNSVFLTNGNGTLSSFSLANTLQIATATGGGVGVAVDALGYVWSINSSGDALTKFSDLGVALSTYHPAGLNGATALAFDGNNNLWVTNGDGSLQEFSNAGMSITRAPGSTMTAASSVAIDIAGNVWVTNSATNSVDEILGGAAPVLPLASVVQSGTPATKP